MQHDLSLLGCKATCVPPSKSATQTIFFLFTITSNNRCSTTEGNGRRQYHWSRWQCLKEQSLHMVFAWNWREWLMLWLVFTQRNSAANLHLHKTLYGPPTSRSSHVITNALCNCPSAFPTVAFYPGLILHIAVIFKSREMEEKVQTKKIVLSSLLFADCKIYLSDAEKTFSSWLGVLCTFYLSNPHPPPPISLFFIALSLAEFLPSYLSCGSTL